MNTAAATTAETIAAAKRLLSAAASARQEILSELEREFDLPTKISSAIADEPAMILLGSKLRLRATLEVPTIGVGVNPRTLGVEMAYNPLFLRELSDKHLKNVLKHEFYHILLGHITDQELTARAAQVVGKDRAHGFVNIAMDLAINSMICGHGADVDALPEGGCIPTVGSYENMPWNKFTEWYLEALLNQQQEQDQQDQQGQQGGGGGGGKGDSSDGDSGESDGDNGESDSGESDSGSGEGGDSSDGESDSSDDDGDGEGESEGEGDSDGDSDGEGDSGSGQKGGQGDESKTPWKSSGSGLSEAENRARTGQGGRGVHEGFCSAQDMDAAIADAADNALTAMLGQLEQEMRESGKSWGSVSQQVRGSILARFRTRPVDWRSLLSQFVGRLAEGDYSTTYTRVNRRLPYAYPGQRVGYTARIGVFVDQSGSMSNELLGLLFSQLDKLSEEIEFVYCPFDNEVFTDHVETWETGSRPTIQRIGYGGTSFDPAVDYTVKNGFEGIIMVTDMYAPTPRRSPVPRLWLTDHYGKSYNDSSNVAGRDKVVVVTPVK
jgi:predicted metal-dependent peptidase